MFQPGCMADRKRISAPGPLGKDEAQQALVARQLGATADHVAHVFLGQLVVGEVDGREAVAHEVARDAVGLVAARDRDADEDVRQLARRRCGS